MTAISEKFSKKGRPKKYGNDIKSFARGAAECVGMTDRGLRDNISSSDCYYRFHKARKIEQFSFLLHPKTKRTICAALGRIDDDGLMFLLAEKICEHRMPTAAAIGYIRRVLGTQKAKDFESLDRVICTAINRYCLENLSITDDDILNALEMVKLRLTEAVAR